MHRVVVDLATGTTSIVPLSEAEVEAALIASQPTQAQLVAGVKAEAQRRIIALTGTTDLISCMIKQSNANMRANELNDIRFTRDLTAAEEAEAEALRTLASAIKTLRTKSNELEAMDPIPADFASDAYWT